MMRWIAICGVIWLLSASAAPMRAQNVPDAPAPRPADPHAAQKPGSSPATPASQPPPASPSSSNDNAFPEDQSKAAAKRANGDADATETGDKKTPVGKSAADKSAADKSAADDNAFPEDKSEAAAKAAGASGEPDTDSPDVSSSRKADEKGSDPGLAADLPKQGEVALAPDPKRAAKDVQVGKFYLDSKDYKGAYVRFKEATTLSPEDPEIVFLLAESARRLDHLDEAVTYYKQCLQLDPDGPKAKAAKRALAEFDKLAAR